MDAPNYSKPLPPPRSVRSPYYSAGFAWARRQSSSSFSSLHSSPDKPKKRSAHAPSPSCYERISCLEPISHTPTHFLEPNVQPTQELNGTGNVGCLKLVLMGCKWSSLNSPGTQSCHSHSIVELDDSPFPIISPLG